MSNSQETRRGRQQRNSSERNDNPPSTTVEAEDTSDNVNNFNLSELMYAQSAIHGLVTPVVMTMVLSALAVTFVSTEAQRNSTENALAGMYTVFDVDGGDDGDGGFSRNASNLGLSLVNGLIIVSVIAAMTFGIVLLYKYRCIKLLVGYMILSSAVLLGLTGGFMFDVFLERYRIPLDQITFYFILVNFAIVGTIAIFYQKGIPMKITQCYLVATSVILAWQLSHFGTWMAWTLLVLLALYDLCAVLTPCGPLKFLVNLISKEGAPNMPGLLYESQLQTGVDRPAGNNANDTNSSRATTRNGRERSTNNRERSSMPNSQGQGNAGYNEVLEERHARDKSSHEAISDSKNHNSTESVASLPQSIEVVSAEEDGSVVIQTGEKKTVQQKGILKKGTARPTDFTDNPQFPAGSIPLAIALVYRLRIISPEDYVSLNEEMRREQNSISNRFSRTELRSFVRVRFPVNGGKIIMTDDEETYGNNSNRRINQNESELRCTVFDRHGVTKRVLVVNNEGRVLEEVESENPSRSREESSGNNSIKLGLGDFIFYSVLVAKAAQYSFTTFAACTLVILTGLGMTLALLSVYHKALPALPISIFLGVLFFLITRFLIQPYIEETMRLPIYV